MDLALHFGITLADLKRRLSEKEFLKWSRYSERYMLPQRRLELYLAQIAMWAARGPTTAECTLQDFLFDPPENITPQEAFENDAELLGFNPTED